MTKLSIHNAEFRRLVERVARIVDRKPTHPILGHVLLEAEVDGSVSVTATDLDVWLRCSCPAGTATVEAPIAVCLRGGLLADLAKRLGETGEVVIDVKDPVKATLRSGRSRFGLLPVSAAEWPAMPIIPDFAARFDLAPAKLAAISDACEFAIGEQESRPQLMGIYWHNVDGALVACSVDGHMLSRISIEVDGELPAFTAPTIPSWATKWFASLRDAGGSHAVQISISDNLARFEGGDMVLVSKLIGIPFPDYVRAIPVGNNWTGTMRRDALAEAVKRLLAIRDDKERIISMTWDAGEVGLRIKGSLDLGAADGEDAVACVWTGDEGFEVTLNGRYLIDALGTFCGPDIVLAFASDGRSAVITNPADETRLVVLMAWRKNDG